MSPPLLEPTRQTVAIVGFGGIGAALAGALRAADRHDVIACARRPIERLTLDRAEGVVELSLRTVTDPAQVGPVDWVMLCTKAHHTPSTAPWLDRLCTERTRVAVLQNGIGQIARAAPYAHGATIVPTVVYYNGERVADDRVRLRKAGTHEIVVSDDEAAQALVHMLDGAGLRILLSDDFPTVAWRKLLLNVVVNPITTLTLQRQGVLRRDDVFALSLQILEEAVAVARADGAKLAEDEPARIMATLMSFSPDLGTSMYFDRLAGRTLEIEALTGAVVAAGERYGVAVPINRALLVLLRAVSDAAG
ncbi:MAG TPA: 2-dehydropantoate 2-reductase [Rhodopila sp.]|nr:2-dehydropantoate 2-reductase [Rhodopila sp.]